MSETSTEQHLDAAGMARELRTRDRIVVAGHVTPDADCVGSIGGLTLALRAAGVEAAGVLPDETIGRRLRFLVDAIDFPRADVAEIEAAGVLAAVDTAKAPRLNLPEPMLNQAAVDALDVLNIDHHATNTVFGQHNWIDPRRSSTAEMVFELLEPLGVTLTPEIATLLYAGIYSDTQGFSLPNTTPRALQVAALLAEGGAELKALGERLQRSQSINTFNLLRVIYDNTQVTADGKIAHSSASHQEIIEAGCSASDIDDQVEIPRSIEGISIALLFSEGTPGKIRVNLRGEAGLSVLEVAQQFGGGGHHAAAGAIITGSIAEARERVLAASASLLASRASEGAA